ncbi:MAG TPA: hypothetical protein VJ436_12705, partial [Anaerolineales bacterium]|nr:hypothetical protein [Anaerolineales bacterium]
APSGSILVERDGQQTRLSASAGPLPDPLELAGEWEFSPESANALVIGKWLSTAEIPATEHRSYTGPQADDSAWLPMVPGAWAYQLPAEPTTPYPMAVWYRIPFQVERLPEQLDLIIDGFAGTEWHLYLNGQAVSAEPARSPFDAQMKSVDIRPQARLGDNLIALRLVLTNSTDGLLDLLKLLGDFSLAGQPGAYRIAEPRPSLQPGSWSSQGYPHYSGRATYRQRFYLPESFQGKRVFLEPAMDDDVLEVLVNGRPAGVRLWEPYTIEISDLLQSGENLLELRVANTLANLLEAVERPSGLAGVPSLHAENDFMFTFGS